jgi:hypothetical protein
VNLSPDNKRKNSVHKPETTEGILKRLDGELDVLKKKLILIGYLFEELSKSGVMSCLVGGEAVELYTAGQFVTGDIDITVSDRSVATKLLQRVGFEREGMIWLNEKLKIAVQVVATHPSHAEKIRVIQVEGYAIRVVGVEDLIVDRLVAAKYWRSNPGMDTEQATVLYQNFRQSIDTVYLERRVGEENIEDIFKEIQRFAK